MMDQRKHAQKSAKSSGRAVAKAVPVAKVEAKTKLKSVHARQIIAILVIVFSGLALIASIILTADLIHILRNPNTSLSCNINPVLSCQSVMKTWQADLLFGMPNSLIGVAAFAVMLTFGVLILMNVKLPRWMWIGLWLGVLGGLAFAGWMLDQSLYAIGVLCPFCLIVDFSTVMIFGALSQHIFRNNLMEFNAKTNAKIAKFVQMDGVKVVVVALIVLAFLLIYARFGNALFS